VATYEVTVESTTEKTYLVQATSLAAAKALVDEGQHDDVVVNEEEVEWKITGAVETEYEDG
jgi:hypothetical protein